jgi:hypothetical protein
MKKVPTSEVVQMLDYAARQRAWYCLDMGRDNAVAMLENLQDMLYVTVFIRSHYCLELLRRVLTSPPSVPSSSSVPFVASFYPPPLSLSLLYSIWGTLQRSNANGCRPPSHPGLMARLSFQTHGESLRC